MDVPRRDRRPASRQLLVIAAATAVVSGICIVAIDQPVARAIARYEPSAVWDQVITWLEYAIGWPVHRLFAAFVLAAAMLVALAVPRLRRYAPALILIAGTHIIARFLTGHVKDLTGRLRPHPWLERGGDETFLWEGGIAFPSGHVVMFASTLIPLAIVAPRTRWLLAIVAFVMTARVAVNAHYVSDVIAAITLVALVAWGLALAIRPR